MALIKCSECSAEISDKATCCPQCGAPVVVHKWRCSQCGNLISKEPCPYCSGEVPLPTPPTPVSKPAVPKKQNTVASIIGMTVSIIVGLVLIAVIMSVSQGGSGSSKSKGLDPNRTTESCSFKGTTKVFPATHDYNCYPDADGYYWPAFGHHHHK